MKIKNNHLTYCSNIHPGTTWEAHFKELKENVPGIREKLAAGKPFALGLRLSNDASLALEEPRKLVEFRNWLTENNLYVFTMNGFPYGNFHGTPVKDKVHAPDWTTRERTEYTKRLFRILAKLLPKEMNGSISTSPLSYKFWWKSDAALKSSVLSATTNIIEVVSFLMDHAEETGQVMHLDIENEPDGVLDNGKDFLRWYKDILLVDGAKLLAKARKLDEMAARETILRHVGLCYDVCHFAVSYEDSAVILRELESLGIRIGKIQISSAVRVLFDERTREKLEAIKALNEPVYLHQVVARKNDGSLLHFSDLPQALENWDSDQKEWRIHFHVPVFIESYGLLGSTQNAIKKMLRDSVSPTETRYLEVETYTWGVLPEEIRKPISESIVRELEWLVAELASLKNYNE